MGANKNENPDFDQTHNFDMPAEFIKDKAWPAKRDGEWHHSDFKEVPYQHTRKLYEKFVELMGK